MTEKEQLQLVAESFYRLLDVVGTLPFDVKEFVGIDGPEDRKNWAMATDIARIIDSGKEWKEEDFDPSWYGVEDEEGNIDLNQWTYLPDDEEEAELFFDKLEDGKYLIMDYMSEIFGAEKDHGRLYITSGDTYGPSSCENMPVSSLSDNWEYIRPLVDNDLTPWEAITKDIKLYNPYNIYLFKDNDMEIYMGSLSADNSMVNRLYNFSFPVDQMNQYIGEYAEIIPAY